MSYIALWSSVLFFILYLKTCFWLILIIFEFSCFAFSCFSCFNFDLILSFIGSGNLFMSSSAFLCSSIFIFFTLLLMILGLLLLSLLVLFF